MFSISKIAPDWETKGFHVHVAGVEVAIRPGQGGTLVYRRVFRATTDKELDAAEAVIRQDLGDLGNRRLIRDTAIRARNYLAALGSVLAAGRAAEMHFLIKAIEKMGV